jgi:antitoxin Phd
MATWQVQQAKTRLSELIEDAGAKGPQVISRHGTDRAVVLSIGDYDRLAAKDQPEQRSDLIEFLLGGPKLDSQDEFFRAIQREHHRYDVDFDD